MENKNPLQQIIEGYGELHSRVAVLNLFCQALIPALDAAQRPTVEAAFRESLDRFLAISDDLPKAAVHHVGALQVANVLFGEFERLRPTKGEGDA